jgi:2,3-dihydroxybenzoate-AMP ligase
MLEGFTPVPEDRARRYREFGVWEGYPLGWYVDEWARRYATREAVTDGATRLTYQDLADLSTALAKQLRARGLLPRQRLLLQWPNGVEFVILLFALFKADIIPVLALPAHREFELSKLVDHAEVQGFAFSSDWAEFDYEGMVEHIVSCRPQVVHLLTESSPPKTRLASASIRELTRSPVPDHVQLSEPDPEDVGLFLLSGGTTGVPKIIPRTHNDYAYNFRQCGQACGFGPDTVYLAALSMAHNFPLGSPGILATLHAGGRVVVARDAAPETVLPLMIAEKVTTTAVVPAIALRWAESALFRDAGRLHLQVLQVGGTLLLPEAARRVRQQLGCQIQQVFGMAEGLINVTALNDDDEVIDNTQGRPVSPWDEVRIVDDLDRPVPVGSLGHLLTRGPYTICGYYAADAVNQESFTRDGFYRTGDIVHWDASGNLVVDGRANDLINRGGEKVSAEEVENLLLSHHGVLECAVVAMPDEVLGERACAYVIARPGTNVTLHDLARHLQALGVAKYKWPERLELIEKWPLTAVGKVNKKVLREQLLAKLKA